MLLSLMYEDVHDAGRENLGYAVDESNGAVCIWVCII